MAERKSDFTLTKLDDLFTTQEQRDDAKLSKIRDIPLSEIDDFPEHPFKVIDDEDMLQLVESIKERGVITPATVRQKEDGRYELISGHRRKRASELAGFDTLRCEVVDLTRDEVNLERGTLTEKVEVSREDQQAMAEAHLSKRLDKTPSEDIPVKKKTKGGTIGLNDFESPATDVLNEGSNPTEVLSDNATEVLSSNETEVLSDTTNATEVLSSNETEVLSNNATEVLSDSTTVLSEGTTVLSENVEVSENLATPISFKVTKDKTITHSDEVIE